MVKATKWASAISSALRPSISAPSTRASRCVSRSKVAWARSVPARSSRSSSSSAARSARPMTVPPARTWREGRVELVEHGALADPTGGAGFDALRQDHAAPLGGQHHDLRSCRQQWSDELDPAADTAAEVDVQEHTLRLEALRMSDHVECRRPADRLHVPTTCGQRQLQPNRHQRVIIDDEHPPAHRTTAGCRATRGSVSGEADGELGRLNANDAPPPGRRSTVSDPAWSTISRRAMNRPSPEPELCAPAPTTLEHRLGHRCA